MDPRRRLQALSSANPSLRLQVMSQNRGSDQTIRSVGTAHPQNLSIQTPRGVQVVQPTQGTIASDPAASGPRPNPVIDTLFRSTAKTLNTGIEGAHSIVELGRAGTAAITHNNAAYQAALDRGLENFSTDKGTGIGGEGGVFSKNQLSTAINPAQFTRKVVGTGAGVAGEIAPFSAGRLVSPTASLARKVGAEAAISAAQGAIGSAGEQLGSDEGKISLGRTLLDTGIAGAAGGLMPIVGKALGAVKNKIAPTAKSVGLDPTTIKIIKKSKDPEEIHTLLSTIYGDSSEALQALSQKLAGTNSRREIIKAIADLPIEGGVAGTGSALVSNAVAKGRYGEGPLTGESAPHVAPEVPEQVVPFGEQAPGLDPHAGQEGIPITNSALDTPLPNDQIDWALKTAQAEDNIRMSPLNENAKEVVSAPENIKAVVRGATPDTNDALNTAVNAIAKTPNKAEVRTLLEGLFKDSKNGGIPALQGNDLNRAVKDLTKESVPQKVLNRLDEELNKVYDKQSTPVAPAPEAAPSEELVKGAPDQGAAAPEVKPNEAAAQTETPTDTNVSEQVNKNADEASGLMTDGTPEEHATVQKIMDQLHEAQSAYGDKTKEVSKQKAARIAAAEEAFKSAGGGEAGIRAKLRALEGAYKKSDYTPIALDPEEETHMLNAIQSSGLQPFEKLNTQNALRKVWGANPAKPTQSDINYIRRFFNDHNGEGTGDAIAEGIQNAIDQNLSPQEIAGAVAGLPKSLMATFDFSAPRQAGALAARHPIIFAKEFKNSVKAAFDPAFYEKQVKDWADSPEWSTIADDMGVNLPAVTGKSEEKYANAQVAERIPIYGKTVVKGSERAYNSLLTGVRFEVAKKVVQAAGGPEGYTKAMDNLFGENAKEAKEAYGEVINTLAGRGGAKGGVLEKHMSTASVTLFSPRLWAANIQRLNPLWYAKMFRKNPAAAKEAIQAQAAFMAMVGTTLFLASKAPGVDVGTDMRSADFGKIKIGNTRFDIMGGQQQNIVQAWRQITGEKVNSETGEVKKLGEGYGSTNRFDLFIDMLISKSNPLINTAVQIAKSKDNPDSNNPLSRQTQYGDNMNIAGSVGQLAVPLNLSGIVGTAKDTGSVAKGIAFNAPGFVGVGVNTYGTTKTKDKGKTLADGTVEFKGKLTDDMVLDDNGKAILDAKGVPVKVKIPEGATKAEIRAIKDEKRQSALKDVYKRSVSEEDQALLKRSDAELKKYVSDGTISQSKYDSLKQERNKIDNIGKADESTVPDGLTGAAASWYKKYNTLDKDAKDAFTKDGHVSPESKALVEEMNNLPDRPTSVPKLGKGNNQLAKLYADYVADMAKNGDTYTDIDKQNKHKTLWNKAIKTQYDSVAQDLYSEGNSKDFKALAAEGKITKKQLDQAIELDNALYQTGWNSLRFKKKFREDYGYGLPSKTADGKHSLAESGKGGKSSSAKSENQHLGEYVSAIKFSKGEGGIPKVPTKSRHIQFKSSANIPSGSSNTKKISINL